MSSSPAWDAPTPGDRPRFIPIIRAVVGATVRLIALNAGCERTFVHFLFPPHGGPKGRTVPCVGKGNGCWCDQFPLRRCWYGYLGAWQEVPGRLVVAEITSQAWRESNVDLGGEILSVRGLPFRMWRRGRSPHSPVRIEFDPRRELGYELPPPFDVRAALEHTWGIERLNGQG